MPVSRWLLPIIASGCVLATAAFQGAREPPVEVLASEGWFRVPGWNSSWSLNGFKAAGGRLFFLFRTGPVETAARGNRRGGRGLYQPEKTTWVKIKNPNYSQAAGSRDFFGSPKTCLSIWKNSALARREHRMTDASSPRVKRASGQNVEASEAPFRNGGTGRSRTQNRPGNPRSQMT
jgi:hypothetical protein